MKHRNGHLPRCQEFTGWCRRTETRQPRQQKEFKFYKNQNLSGKLSKKRKQALAQAVTELLHASGLQYTQVAKIENRDQTKEQQKRRFFGWRAFFKLAAARPQKLVGKVIGRGVFNRSPFSSLPCYWSSIFDQSLLSSIFFSPFSQFHLKRRAALSWIREHGSDEGVVYFADDDNSYDTRIFEEIRKTRWLQICFFLSCAWRSHVNMEGGLNVIFDLLGQAVNSHIEGVCQCSRWASSSSTGWVLRSWGTERSPASMMHSRLAVRCDNFSYCFREGVKKADILLQTLYSLQLFCS